MRLSLIIFLISFQSFGQNCWSSSNADGSGMELTQLENGIFVNEAKAPYSGEVYSWFNESVRCAQGRSENGLRVGEWKTFFIGGSLESVGMYIKGKPQGTFKFYHPSGKPHGEINHDADGKAQGPVTWFYEDGTMEAQSTFVNDKLEGLVSEYYKNGQIKTKTHYSNGKKNGTNSNFHESGSQISEENWKNDLKDGAFIKYGTNGTKSIEEFYVENKRHGELKQYDQDGRLASVTTYGMDVQNGPEITFDAQGDTSTFYMYKNKKIVLERNFKAGKVSKQITYDNNGKEHGPKIEYFTNVPGQIASIHTFEHGNLKGEWLEYYKSGILKSRKLHGIAGECLEYYESGNLKSRTQCGIEGEWTAFEYYDYETVTIAKKTEMLGTLKHGAYTEYKKNGSISVESHYAQGKLHGVHKEFWSADLIKELQNYENDQRHGRYESYNSIGKLEEEGSYDKGKKQGEFKKYHSSGKPKSSTFFFNGKKHGEYIEWNEKGKIVIQGKFENGDMEGVWLDNGKESEYIHGVIQN